jgi:O-antigen/teichoic acid export membrane protein
MAPRSFFGNSVLNFVGQVFVMVVAIVSIPTIVHGLGYESFGLLTLLWMFVGYFTVFDLGVGQAAIKFLAEHLKTGDREGAGGSLRSVLSVSATLGVAGGLVACGASLIGIERFVNVPPNLQRAANEGLQVLALGVPASLVSASLRSVPYASGRFDIINGLQGVNGLLQWAGTAFVVTIGGGFLGVVLLTLASRYLILAAYAAVTHRFLPETFHRSSGRGVGSRTLLWYGGWVSVSQIAAPLLSLIERLLVSWFLSLAWVTYYSVPSDGVLRLLIVPMSLVGAFFPLMSGEWLTPEGRVRAKNLYFRSLKIVAVLLLPVVLILALFSGEILTLWLGREFSEHSAVVLSLLALGTLFNGLSQLPQTALQAMGRPDQPAKLALAQIPLYAALSALLTSVAGIVGTAIGWVLRATVEAVILLSLAARGMRNVRAGFDRRFLRRGALLAGGLALALLAAKISLGEPIALTATVAGILLLFGIGLWHLVLDGEERELVCRLVDRRGGTTGGSKGGAG